MTDSSLTTRTMVNDATAPPAAPLDAPDAAHAQPPPPPPPSPRRPMSFRRLVAFVVVLPVAAVSAALVMLSRDTSQRIADDLAATLTTAATDSVRDDLAVFLGQAIEVSDRYERRVREGRLPASGDLSAWRQPMFDDLATTPNVASICFGAISGDAVWLLRGTNAPRELEYGYSDRARDAGAVEFPADPVTGTLGATPIRVYRYDPRERPWYRTAVNQVGPLWTPIYFWFGEAGADRTTGTGYTRVVRDGSGAMLGVLVIDVTLEAISKALKELPIAHKGFAFIVDERGLVVAASHGRVNSASGTRLTLAETGDPFARAVASLPYMSDAAATTVPMHRFTIGEEPARATVRQLSPYPGINWRVIAGAPESAFLAEAKALQRRQVVLASVAAAGSAVLALLLGRQVSRPLLRLTEHVRRVGRGDLDARLDLQATREMQELSLELNRMSAGLKQQLELERSLELAREVQQSLLPTGVPQAPGLDLAAQCRYCDSTGGDYYDFIEDANGNAVVVVGDALGHGISSALLMATARAALRAGAAEAPPPSLGAMLTRVNDVLCHGERSGRFMTMLLITLDPQSRSLRWARAGHEPFLLYDPAAGDFAHLSGGSIPLGIEPVAYGEHRHDDLAPGTVIVAATDGLWEATNRTGEMFGRHRVRDALREATTGAGATAHSIVNQIDAALTRFLDGAKIKDDVTFVVIRVAE